jgi:hypothetical protein
MTKNDDGSTYYNVANMTLSEVKEAVGVMTSKELVVCYGDTRVEYAFCENDELKQCLDVLQKEVLRRMVG